MAGKTWFFPIGITDRPGEPALTGIAGAIEALSAYVRDNFPDPQVGDEYDRDTGNWDHDAVVQLLDVRLQTLDPSDTVVIYWAGHGVTGDGSHQLLLTRNSILTRQLAGWLCACPALTIVCILDCCWSGEGLGDLVSEAEELRKQVGAPARELQTVTVIASARSEPAQEGAFVAAMTHVLTHGPGPRVGSSHRWGPEAASVTPAELVEAVRVRLHDEGLGQQAIHVNLRYSDVGRFFPSIWYARSRRAGGRPVDGRSRARRVAEEQFRQLGISPPDSWTEAGLEAHGRFVEASPGLRPNERLFLSATIDTLRLALSSETLAWSLVDRLSFTDAALRSARRAATRQFDDPPIGRQFDLFHDAAAPRSVQHPIGPVEASIRFVTRLVHECGGDPADRRLFEWAAARGLEANEVNRILAEATKPAPLRRLVIRLQGDRHAEGDFPRSATGQVFEDGEVSGDRSEEPIAPATVAGAVKAVAALVERKQRERFQVVDVVVPDELILLDPGTVPVRQHRRFVELGSICPVSVRSGSRFGYQDWEQLSAAFLALTRSRCHLRCIEDWPSQGSLFHELTDPPPVVVFRSPAPAGSPPDALLDAVQVTPIVVWLVAELDEPCPLPELVDAHWPLLQAAVAAARWRRAPPSASDEHQRHLHHLRMLWEDDQWADLAQKMENYG